MRNHSVWIALFLGCLIAAYLFVRKEERRAPASEMAAVPPTPKIQSKQEISPPTPTLEPPAAPKWVRNFPKNLDLDKMEELRKAASLEEAPTGIPGLVAVPSLQAIPKKQYQSRLGPEHTQQSGYVVFKSDRAQSTVQSFDGQHFPIVKYPGRSVLGVVTGEIEVVFKNYPQDVSRYARLHGLTLSGEMKNIKTIYFSAKNFPANLTEIVESFTQLPEVERAEVSVIYGNRRGT